MTNPQPKAMTREYLDILVTKARINTEAMAAIARLKIRKFSFQTTVLQVRFWDASQLSSAPATCTCLFQGKDTGFYQLRMWPRSLTQMPCECLCPLGFEEMWSGNPYTCVGVLAKGLPTGFKVNTYKKMRPG